MPVGTDRGLQPHPSPPLPAIGLPERCYEAYFKEKENRKLGSRRILMSTRGGITAVYGAHREDRFAPSSSLDTLFRLFLPGTQAHEVLIAL